MTSARAYAKINLGLVVGPRRSDDKHQVVTVLERIELADTIALSPAPGTEIVVEGFADTIVREALAAFVRATAAPGGWRAHIEKRIPVAAGLGGGSSDAAAALVLANELRGRPLGRDELHEIACRLGADVPFFLRDGAQRASGDGTELVPVSIPRGIPVVLVLPDGERKRSTAAVYERFDARGGAEGFEARREVMLAALGTSSSVRDLASLPGNDLASSPLADELRRVGAVRADVSGAGPAVYGLFEGEETAASAAETLRAHGRTWLTRTVGGR